MKSHRNFAHLYHEEGIACNLYQLAEELDHDEQDKDEHRQKPKDRISLASSLSTFGRMQEVIPSPERVRIVKLQSPDSCIESNVAGQLL